MDIQNLIQNHLAQMAGSAASDALADHEIQNWMNTKNQNSSYGINPSELPNEHLDIFNTIKNDFLQKNGIDEN